MGLGTTIKRWLGLETAPAEVPTVPQSATENKPTTVTAPAKKVTPPAKVTKIPVKTPEDVPAAPVKRGRGRPAGTKVSAETRAKLSAAAKKSHAARKAAAQKAVKKAPVTAKKPAAKKVATRKTAKKA